ncbi:LysR substrate-binding domain-containing protein [Corynebacterium lubricantis]|uniref:LysR substrate-binding domain-containing protein n=1 Tax=Corynebacterium lubricantis TaxID=541095 RepID=UPI00037B0CD0|nr:LysR substrate-binding domain-containing protein [Corynebacterium lubricantis]
MSPVIPNIDQWLSLSMLRLLTSVAELGSLSAAAQSCGIAQSNASRSMKTLERRLGYPLLHRTPQGSSLTQEGKLTVEWARGVLDAVDRLAAGAESLAHAGHEQLSISASMTIAEHLLPGWLGEFRKQQPQVSTKLRVLNSADVIASVESGAAALGFVETPTLPTTLHSAPVWTDQLVVVVGAEHPWATRSAPLGMEELAATPLIEREEGSGTRAFLDYLVSNDRPAPLLELNSISAICHAVMESIGPAVLSRLAVDSYLRAGQLVEVPTDGMALNRLMHVLWRGEADSAEAVRNFLDVVGTKTRTTNDR